MINIGSTSLGGRIIYCDQVNSLKFNNIQDKAKIQFQNPVCANIGEKIAMSRRIEKNFRLIGWGEVKSGSSKKSNK